MIRVIKQSLLLLDLVTATRSLHAALPCSFALTLSLIADQQLVAQPAASNSSPTIVANPTSAVSTSTDGTKAEWLSISNCQVFYIDKVAVSVPESGRLGKVLVERNQEITAKQTIAQIDDNDLQLELHASQLQFNAAKQQADDSSDIQYSQAMLDEANAELENYESANERTAGSFSKAEIRRLRLAKLRAELGVQRSIKQQEQAKIQLEIRSAAITALRDRIARRVIAAPFDGTVISVLRKQGEWVESGTTIAEVARMNPLQVDAFIDFKQYDPTTLVGKAVQVTVTRPGMGPVTFPGTISSYDPTVSSNGQVRIHAKIQNRRSGQDWLLLPGMIVSMDINKSQLARNTLANPKR